ncbi:MAG: sulfotransferase [Phenylobacterium sp.]|uniref:sulfotransferase n=1 Tax=Phenylobacterium sp. TaxID=1871053 RepID=UPI0027346C1D|nr:sulfotransferase [Phenylobacterium sp.]MDP3746899.1 sulfotransferase [Phenylobacterium sp.]
MRPLSHCWGVGLARTGNTSLCAALRLLGYDPVEQDPAFDAMRDLHAACGNTVVLHYKYLDFVFPGSKFVLTTRPVEDWLRSMERSHLQNPRPITGQHDRIARRMAIYETVGYDIDVLTEAYCRHHAEVRRYFGKRPGDLLELDIAGGEHWDPLCAHLGVTKPAHNFPNLNRGFAI